MASHAASAQPERGRGGLLRWVSAVSWAGAGGDVRGSLGRAGPRGSRTAQPRLVCLSISLCLSETGECESRS